MLALLACNVSTSDATVSQDCWCCYWLQDLYMRVHPPAKFIASGSAPKANSSLAISKWPLAAA
jgi:hypothetical protein